MELDQASAFLKRVLPDAGDAYLNIHYPTSGVDPKTNRNYWKGEACRSIGDMVKVVDRLGRANHAKGDVYVCMSSQRAADKKVVNGRTIMSAVKKRMNVVHLRSLYLDIDVKEGGYETGQDAVNALNAFCDALDMPPPNVVVASGSGGLHVYWTLDRALMLDEWQPLADALAKAATEHGLLCDTQVTKDAARVLRVPGTFNHKTTPPNPVKLLIHDKDPDYSVKLMREKLAPFMKLNVIPLPGMTSKAFGKSGTVNDELTAGMQIGPRPIQIETIAENGCGFVREGLETGGEKFAQPLWNIATLIATFTEDGREQAHKLAKGHPEYDPEETHALYDRKLREREEQDIGWPSCEAIATGGCKSCATCPHFAKGKSPLHLGVRSVGGRELPFGPFERTANGGLKASFKNAMLALHELRISCRLNIVSGKVILGNAEGFSALPSEYCGLYTENALRRLRMLVQEHFDFDPGREHLDEAVQSLAELDKFNPIIDWLDSLAWDGRKRLTLWLPKTLGAPNNALNRNIGSRLVLAMVARARFPGLKYDACVVLEGPQGCGKSRLVRKLASGPGDDYFSDAPGLIAMDHKARAELLEGQWVVELAELAGLGKKEKEEVKAFLSLNTDFYRRPYARVPSAVPRTCVFIATTNDAGYLSDPTGNRRFLPIRCGSINHAYFDSIRDQLFAEANARLKHWLVLRGGDDAATAKHWLPRLLALPPLLQRAADEEADERRLPDALEDALPLVLNDLENSCKSLGDGLKLISTQALRHELGLRFAVNNLSGLSTHMAQLGWEPCRQRVNGQLLRGYRRRVS